MGVGEEGSEKAVRAMMRDGLSDDAIAERTGLDLISILELRAAAAVEDRTRPPQADRNDASD